MTDKTAPTSCVRRHGKPQGFLEHVDRTSRPSGTESVDEGILVITLDPPAKLNASTSACCASCAASSGRRTSTIPCASSIITGSGRAFCSGRDINGLDYENNLLDRAVSRLCARQPRLFDDLEAIEKPVIAAINGVCAGGGVEMAVACDFRMAARRRAVFVAGNSARRHSRFRRPPRA